MATSTAATPKTLKAYLRLAEIWPPHVPRDDDDYEAGAEAARALSARAEAGEKLSEGETMYLEAALVMLEAYDAEHNAMPAAADLPLPERLRGLMEVSEVNQSELAEVAGISRGNMSDILAGRRGLSKESAKRLARQFRVGVEFFL
jgi:HTH-type transcriptional regulator/antitoxin HigA